MKKFKFKKVSIEIYDGEEKIANIYDNITLKRITFFIEPHFADLRKSLEFYLKKNELILEDEVDQLEQMYRPQ